MRWGWRGLELRTSVPPGTPRRDQLTWHVGCSLVAAGAATLLTALVLDATWGSVTGAGLVLVGYGAASWVLLRAVNRDGRRRLAELAARQAALTERYEARRAELRDLAARVFGVDRPDPADVARLGELLDAAWAEGDLGPGLDEDVR